MYAQNVDLNINWSLKDYPEKNNFKVFSCFACGGGSTMGYKLSGFNVIGINELDKNMIKVYKANHETKLIFEEDIREFNKRDNLPNELFNLDILDGSPPCSSFSMTGNREKDWHKEKKFKEGQKKQRLDDLVFEFLETVKKLKPKIVILENVKGLISGLAKNYANGIQNRFKEIGYKCQLFLLNAATMGISQKRERVFFIARRKDLNLPNLKLNFNKKTISFKEATNNLKITQPKNLTKKEIAYWNLAKIGQSVGKYSSNRKINPNKPLNTITAEGKQYHYSEQRRLAKEELIISSTFPINYNFLNLNPRYIIGMSVPPFMIMNIAKEIKKQWLMR